jgi:hypothetical protein
MDIQAYRSNPEPDGVIVQQNTDEGMSVGYSMNSLQVQ